MHVLLTGAAEFLYCKLCRLIASLALDFVGDVSFDEIIRIHIEDERAGNLPVGKV